MKRFRWFQVRWPSSIRVLAKRIAKRTFNEESGHGFLIDRVRDDFLEARYVEKIEYTDLVTDPFGNELQFERVEFRNTLFRASSSEPGLELINPPRSVQSLMNRLSEAVDFEVAISPVTLDVLKWAKLFQQSGGVSADIDSLQIGALEIDKGILAKVIIKGDRDVRAACDALTLERNYAIEKAQLRFVNSHRRGTIVLAGTGSATISSDVLADDILALLRVTLTDAVRE